MKGSNKISYIPCDKKEEAQISYIPCDKKEEVQISYIPCDKKEEEQISYIPCTNKEEKQISDVLGIKKEESISYTSEIKINKDEDSKLKKIGECPLCKGDVVKVENKYNCKSCNYKLKNKISNTIVPEDYIKELLKGNHTEELELTDKDGNKYKSKLMLDKKNYNLCLAPSVNSKDKNNKNYYNNVSNKDKTKSSKNNNHNSKKQISVQEKTIHSNVYNKSKNVNESIRLKESSNIKPDNTSENKKGSKGKFAIFILIIAILLSLFIFKPNDEEKIEKLVENYLQGFTSAINECDEELVFPYLTYNGPLYKEQDKFVEYFHNRGIREEIEDFNITKINKIDSAQYEVHVQEYFNILRNNKWELREFKSIYTIKEINKKLLIDELKQEEIVK